MLMHAYRNIYVKLVNKYALTYPQTYYNNVKVMLEYAACSVVVVVALSSGQQGDGFMCPRCGWASKEFYLSVFEHLTHINIPFYAIDVSLVCAMRCVLFYVCINDCQVYSKPHTLSTCRFLLLLCRRKAVLSAQFTLLFGSITKAKVFCVSTNLSELLFMVFHI